MNLAALLILFLVPFLARCQSMVEDSVESPLPSSSAPDSLSLRLAMIEIAKAHLLADESGFWQRLVPQVTIGGGLGMHDIVFANTGGTLVLPKDAYRVSVSLSLSGVFDGSKHALAELQLAESETRLADLLRKHCSARRALEKKERGLAAESSALRAELAVRQSLALFQEMLFSQGRIDFHAVAAARIDLIRIRETVARCEANLREVVETLRAEPSN